MPSWEDGSERYLAEHRGETIYDALHTFSREGKIMNACGHCGSDDLYGQSTDMVRECAVCGAKGYSFDGKVTWASPKTLRRMRRAEAAVRTPFDE